VLGLLVVAAVSLVAFYFVERRVEHPVVPFHLFRLNVFAVPAAISFFSGVGMFGAVIFVPLLYQGVLGVSATNSGQLLTPMMLAVVVTSTATGALGSILVNRLPVPPSRIGLAVTLHDLFVVAAVVAAVAVIASVFLREVPLMQQAESVPDAIEAAA